MNKDDGRMLHIQISVVGSYLNIMVVSTRNDNVCYNCNLSGDDLGNINEGFKQYKGIYEIYKGLNEYIDKCNDKINININGDNIIIKCVDYFDNQTNTNNNDVIFTLHSSLYELRTAKITNSAIVYISNQTSMSSLISNNSHIPIYDNSNINSIIQLTTSQYKLPLHIIVHMFSFILLLFLSLFCVKSVTNVSPSMIITRNDFNIISNWIDTNNKFKYTLLYRATRDGDSSLSFHDHCDNKGNTVTLVLTTTNLIFGGYSDVTWKKFSDIDDWVYKESDKAFIFSMTNKKKYPIRRTETDRAIFLRGSNGPTFGFGHDIKVNNNCLISKSTCNTPTSYGDMTERNEINNGEREFIAKEVEVFLVEKQP